MIKWLQMVFAPNLGVLYVFNNFFSFHLTFDQLFISNFLLFIIGFEWSGSINEIECPYLLLFHFENWKRDSYQLN